MLDAELSSRWDKVQMLKASGEGLVSRSHPNKSLIQRRLHSLMEHWTSLKALRKEFMEAMDAASEFFQYHGDVDEVESWLKETQTILSNMNPSSDMQDVEPLLKRHARLEEEISSYEPDVKRLNEQAAKLKQLGQMFKKLSDTPRLTTPEKEHVEPISDEAVC